VIDGGAPAAYSGADFFLPGPDGPHQLSVSCTDNLGHSNGIVETDFVDNSAPVVNILSPKPIAYLHPSFLHTYFMVGDAGSGIKSVEVTLDGKVITHQNIIDLYTLSLGDHTFTVKATDNVGNMTSKSVTFSIKATVQSTMAGVLRFYAERKINSKGVANSLLSKLRAVQIALDRHQTNTARSLLNSFINDVRAQSGKHINAAAANCLIADAQYILGQIK